jgi:hypothetical protein
MPLTKDHTVCVPQDWTAAYQNLLAALACIDELCDALDINVSSTPSTALVDSLTQESSGILKSFERLNRLHVLGQQLYNTERQSMFWGMVDLLKLLHKDIDEWRQSFALPLAKEVSGTVFLPHSDLIFQAAAHASHDDPVKHRGNPWASIKSTWLPLEQAKPTMVARARRNGSRFDACIFESLTPEYTSLLIWCEDSPEIGNVAHIRSDLQHTIKAVGGSTGRAFD